MSIRTSSRAYPSGRVPRDFPNWLLSIRKKAGIAKRFSKEVKYAPSFPFREPVAYEEKIVRAVDAQGNIVHIVELKRVH